MLWLSQLEGLLWLYNLFRPHFGRYTHLISTDCGSNSRRATWSWTWCWNVTNGYLLVFQPAVVTDSPPKHPGIFILASLEQILQHRFFHPQQVVWVFLWFDLAPPSSKVVSVRHWHVISINCSLLHSGGSLHLHLLCPQRQWKHWHTSLEVHRLQWILGIYFGHCAVFNPKKRVERSYIATQRVTAETVMVGKWLGKQAVSRLGCSKGGFTMCYSVSGSQCSHSPILDPCSQRRLQIPPSSKWGQKRRIQCPTQTPPQVTRTAY